MAVKSKKSIIVGISGGADSMALAWALHRLKFPIVLAHLNHGLRGKESNADEKLVAAFAKKLKVPFESRCVDLKNISGNLEDAGRRARYSFFEELRVKYGADFIAVAHHQDDHLETILMHLLRGASLRGMQGLKLAHGPVIRPLLGLTKKEILAIAKKNKIPYRHDQMNDDLGYARNRLRHAILPKLGAKNRKILAETAEEAQEKLQLLERRAKIWLKAHFRKDAFLIGAFLKASPALRGEILVQMLGAQDFYSKDIVRFVDFIRRGKNGDQCQIKNKIFMRSSGAVYKMDEVPEAKPWGPVPLLAGAPKVSLFMRSWKPGDRFQPAGMQGSKKLQDFFVDAKIPRHLRASIPVIVDKKDQILSVGTLRLSQQGLDLGIKHDIINL